MVFYNSAIITRFSVLIMRRGVNKIEEKNFYDNYHPLIRIIKKKRVWYQYLFGDFL